VKLLEGFSAEAVRAELRDMPEIVR